jgi:hypothetical protein
MKTDDTTQQELLDALKFAVKTLADINGSYLTPARAKQDPHTWGEARRMSLAAQGRAFKAVAKADPKYYGLKPTPLPPKPANPPGDGRCSLRKRQGRTYGRRTAWLPTINGVMRVRLGIGGVATGGQVCVKAAPYDGGTLRLVPTWHLTRTKAEAFAMISKPICQVPLIRWQDYPLA